MGSFVCFIRLSISIGYHPHFIVKCILLDKGMGYAGYARQSLDLHQSPCLAHLQARAVIPVSHAGFLWSHQRWSPIPYVPASPPFSVSQLWLSQHHP